MTPSGLRAPSVVGILAITVCGPLSSVSYVRWSRANSPRKPSPIAIRSVATSATTDEVTPDAVSA